MPTYQYACTECGHAFEIVQSFAEDSLTVCPECGGRLRKVFNAVGVVFKGSGFYRNDSRGKQSESVPSGSKSSESAAGSTSSESTSSASKSTGSTSSRSKSRESTSGESKPAASKPAASKPTG